MAPVCDWAAARDFCVAPVLIASTGLPASSARAAASMKACGRRMPSMKSTICLVSRIVDQKIEVIGEIEIGLVA